MSNNNTISPIEHLLSELNPEQAKAVNHLSGPVLILAGAGSGKTRVLTYRIVNLIASGKAKPDEILAMTFTNKAAQEMRERVRDLIPNSIKGMWVGTFHSLFARILRREADRIGFNHNFSIYDSADQQSLIKKVMDELKINKDITAPKFVSWAISMAKNQMQFPDEYAMNTQNPQEEAVAKIYKLYEKKLREQNAMDFDDLLIRPIQLFDMYPLVKEFYQDRFRHILVDEYQDTNRAQYTVLKMLAEKYTNICVVGDDDQSIYRWRGAELRNILDFEFDYPKCSQYRLEQNYRSSGNILGLAHSVVCQNKERHDKKLWTEKPDGDPVVVVNLYDEREEARMLVQKITEEFRKGDRKFGDFAALYRINAQSRVLEDSLRSENIPYIIIGGVRFYERKEIKDVLGYLRLLVNPADAVSLRRIINYPARGIGESSMNKLEIFALDNDYTLMEALENVQHIQGLQKRIAEKMAAFLAFIKKYQNLLSEISPSEIAASLVEETGMIRNIKAEGTEESASRLENVRELLNAIAEYTQQNPESSLEEYLQQVSLITDIDSWNDRANAVTLMTLHAAKGLEFPVVFMTGLEEGLFPLSRSIEDPFALEEERRLFYVGATRAKEKLYLMWAKKRSKWNEKMQCYKSRFLKEVDPQFVSFEMSASLQRAQDYQGSFNRGYSDDMPDYENESQEVIEFRRGMRVKHFKFGKGTILNVEPQAGGARLLVNFDTAGNKRMVMPYAKLEIL